MHVPWEWHIRQLNYKKTDVVLLTYLLPFLATKGSGVLEKKVNETLVSKTMFSHYNIFWSDRREHMGINL